MSIAKKSLGSRPKSQTAEYRAYYQMLQRCNNRSVQAYKEYGERGIRVCDRWMGEHGFTNFISDMGNKPNSNLTLDRINNNGGYSPRNCRWATRSMQTINTRTQRNNTTGRRGVYKSRNKFRADICINSKRICLGAAFETIDEAIRARQLAEEQYFMPLVARN